MSDKKTLAVAAFALVGAVGMGLATRLRAAQRKQRKLKHHEEKLAEVSEKLTAQERKKRREAKAARQLEAAYSEQCRRRTITYENTIGNLTIREYEGAAECCNTPVIEGFPNTGLASHLTALYLADQLELPLIGEVLVEDLAVSAVVSNYAYSSQVRIYGDETIVIFTSEAKPPEDDAPGYYANMIEIVLDFCYRHSATMLISNEGIPRKSNIDESKFDTQEDMLGAMLNELQTPSQTEDSSKSSKKPKRKRKKGDDDSDSDEDEPQDGEVRFITNDRNLAVRMRNLGHKPLKEGTFEGMTGATICKMGHERLPIICLLSPHDQALPDAKTTVPIITAIDLLLGDDLHVDTYQLERQIKKLEQEVVKALQRLVPNSAMPGGQLPMYM